MQQCRSIIDKGAIKYLSQMQPRPPRLNALIKTHKENMPIRPVINNTQAPSHKLARHIHKIIQTWQLLPNIYNTANSATVATELTNLHIKHCHKIITLDIKDLYTNLPTKGIVTALEHWITHNNIKIVEKEQITLVVKTVLQQNYFMHNDRLYSPAKGVAMGSPVSGTFAELYLQLIEKLNIKHCINTGSIIYYRRYVDDILIIFNNDIITAEDILQQFNNIDKNLTFTMTEENNNRISFLDLDIIRTPNKIELGIYRKDTNTDITIHNTSNHPHEHKIAAYRFYVNRWAALPLTEASRVKEWNIIINTAVMNGFSARTIEKLRQHNRCSRNKTLGERESDTKRETWATFTFYGNYIRSITNIFKNTQIRIAFKSTNTLSQLLVNTKDTKPEVSGIYRLTCETCQGVYIGQTGRSIEARYKEHMRYIKTNNPQSAYALHILNNRHEYGPMNRVMKILKPCRKGKLMNTWETMFIQLHHRNRSLITEQQRSEHNPLYDLVSLTPTTETITQTHGYN